jgi:hypothetical protein
VGTWDPKSQGSQARSGPGGTKGGIMPACPWNKRLSLDVLSTAIPTRVGDARSACTPTQTHAHALNVAALKRWCGGVRLLLVVRGAGEDIRANGWPSIGTTTPQQPHESQARVQGDPAPEAAAARSLLAPLGGPHPSPGPDPSGPHDSTQPGFPQDLGVWDGPPPTPQHPEDLGIMGTGNFATQHLGHPSDTELSRPGPASGSRPSPHGDHTCGACMDRSVLVAMPSRPYKLGECPNFSDSQRTQTNWIPNHNNPRNGRSCKGTKLSCDTLPASLRRDHSSGCVAYTAL